MIAIIPTNKLLAALPRGLFTPTDSLLICTTDAQGRVVLTGLNQFYTQPAAHPAAKRAPLESESAEQQRKHE